MTNPTSKTSEEAVSVLRDFAKYVENLGVHNWTLGELRTKAHDVLAATDPVAIQHGEQRETVPAAEVVHQMRHFGGGEWVQIDEDEDTCLKRIPDWRGVYEFRTLYASPVSAPVPEAVAQFHARAARVGDDRRRGGAQAVKQEGEGAAWNEWESSDEFKRWENSATSHVHFKAGYRAAHNAAVKHEASEDDGQQGMLSVERIVRNAILRNSHPCSDGYLMFLQEDEVANVARQVGLAFRQSAPPIAVQGSADAETLLAALQTAEMAMLGYTARNEVVMKALKDARAAIENATKGPAA